MWRYEAKLFIRVDVSFPVDDPSAEFEILGADSFMPPPLEGGLTDAPKFRELLLVEVGEVHLGFLPYELAGVHEGASAPRSQGMKGATPSSFLARHRRLVRVELQWFDTWCFGTTKIQAASSDGSRFRF